MKKSILLFGFAFLMIAISFSNCSNGPGHSKDLHLMTADTILSQYNHGRPEWDRAIKEEGMVTITTTKDLITIDVVQDSSNESISYFLQTDSTVTSTLSVPAGRAEVLYLDKHLIVNSLDKKQVLYFKIKADKKPAYLDQIQNMQEYDGYGLGLRTVSRGFTLESAPLCTCILAGTAALCTSGGEGSLSCGTANNAGRCKVTCSGASHACCDSKSN
ncbi:MAG: hypothetical protein IPP15_08940 [Saprospiraceae bacterium]|uniref:Lipoprotein n=1 Tax=Candidatus Opimibacter skivensis TaxID=2982028 RepID=A0A9D7SVA0_9BACT|nr:hypothetical protein [Candidatus Opimibacter skivensis]